MKTAIKEHKEIIKDQCTEILDNYECRRMTNDFIEKSLPRTKSLAIIWLDKEGGVSVGFCNLDWVSRLKLLGLVLFQELIRG